MAGPGTGGEGGVILRVKGSRRKMRCNGWLVSQLVGGLVGWSVEKGAGLLQRGGQ